MIAIKPIPMTDVILASSNVTETEYSYWTAMSSYSIGDKVIVKGDHNIYEALANITSTGFSESVYNSQSTSHKSILYEPLSEKVITFFVDSDTYGKYIVSGFSDGVPSSGNSLTFYAGATTAIDTILDTSTGKIIVFYTDALYYLYSIVGSLNGLSVTFGLPQQITTSSTTYISSTYNSTAERVVISYRDSTGAGKSMAGSISGTVVTFGSSAQFIASANHIAITHIDSASKFVIAFSDTTAGGYGTIIVGTITGNAITYGTQQAINAKSTSLISIEQNTVTGNIVLFYVEASPNKTKLISCSISGTFATFGAAIEVYNGLSSYTCLSFESTVSRVIFAYADGLTIGKAGRIIDTGIELSIPGQYTFNNASTSLIDMCYNEKDARGVIAYTDVGNSSYGTFAVTAQKSPILSTKDYMTVPTWLKIKPSNRWAMFDNKISTKTIVNGDLAVVLNPPDFVSGISLHGLFGNELTIVGTSEGVEIYSKTFNLDGSIVDDFWKFLFAPFIQKEAISITDFPPYLSPEISVTIAGQQTACGALVIGESSYLGSAQYGTNYDKQSYSTISTDVFGDTTFIRRGNAGVLAVSLAIENSALEGYRQITGDLIDNPTAYIPTEDDNFSFLNIFGYISTHKDTMSVTVSTSTFEIRELL